MALLMKRTASVHGEEKKQVEETLTMMISKLDRIENELKNRTDHEVWKLFQLQQAQIQKVETRITYLLQYKKEDSSIR